MMRKALPIAAIVLGLSGGVALADRDHDRGRDHGRDHGRYDRGRSSVVIRDNHRDHRNVRYDRGRDHWRGGGRVIVRDNPRHYRTSRRPIYIQRPVIHQRYFNYDRRPQIIVENYNPMAGYYWVPGTWVWTTNEWIWQPGHYEPDQSYIDSSYTEPYYNGY